MCISLVGIVDHGLWRGLLFVLDISHTRLLFEGGFFSEAGLIFEDLQYIKMYTGQIYATVLVSDENLYNQCLLLHFAVE